MGLTTYGYDDHMMSHCRCTPYEPWACHWCNWEEGWWMRLGINLEVAAAMEITRQSAYHRGFENAMAIKGICEPLEEEHAQRIISRG